jgi:phage baseplate assembly protein W
MALENLLKDICHKSDLKRSSTGDLDVIDGLENVKNALFHRLITVPGSLIHRPEYGVGLKMYQNSISSLATQRQLALKIEEQFLRDPRVEEVTSVSVSIDRANPQKVTIIVLVKIVGYGENEVQFTPFGEGI